MRDILRDTVTLWTTQEPFFEVQKSYNCMEIVTSDRQRAYSGVLSG